jgi:hypothetical protein
MLFISAVIYFQHLMPIIRKRVARKSVSINTTKLCCRFDRLLTGAAVRAVPAGHRIDAAEASSEGSAGGNHMDDDSEEFDLDALAHPLPALNPGYVNNQ